MLRRSEEAVVAMLKKKQAGLLVSRERAAPRPQNVANLMDANAVGTAERPTEKCRLTICDRCPIAARKSRRRLETAKIKPASGMPPGVR
jgi:hypothetical protein